MIRTHERLAKSGGYPLKRGTFSAALLDTRQTLFLIFSLIICSTMSSQAFAVGPMTGGPAHDTRSDSNSVIRADSLVMTSTGGAKSVYVPRWYEMITRLPGDWERFGLQSFRTENIPLAVGIAGLTAGLMAADNGLWQAESGWYNRHRGFRGFSNDMVFVGDGRFQFGIVGAFATYGFAFNDSRALRTASEVTEAILATGAVVQFLKHATGRERPEVASEIGGDWTFFPGQLAYLKHVPHYDSFPSGHIATATTTLIVIAENYPEVTWLKPAGYVVLGMISSSLVAYGIHWWSDIPLGIVLGYSFGEIASHPLNVHLDSSSGNYSPKLSFEPVLMQNGLGVDLGLSF